MGLGWFAHAGVLTGQAETAPAALLPLPLQPGTSPPPPIPGPHLLPLALSQLLPLSASFSLALRRKVDVRCVHTSWAGWVGVLGWWGGAAVCMWLCPCLWSLALLAARFQLPSVCPHPRPV